MTSQRTERLSSAAAAGSHDRRRRAGLTAVMSWLASDTSAFISDYVFCGPDASAWHNSTLTSYLPRMKQVW